jgi:TolA-binding protein
MVRTTLAVLCMVSAVSVITTAQSASMADLQRLQDVAFDASNEIAQARARDATTAAQLERELDEVRDDIAYLRGKLGARARVFNGRSTMSVIASTA